MKRNIYIILCVVALGLTGYTTYYTLKHQAPLITSETPPRVIATSTPVVEDKNTYTLKSGRKITLVETNPTGESLSTVTITPQGFATNSPIVLEINKLTSSFYADINQDTHEELIIVTISQGSGSFGDAFIFTSASQTQLLPVSIPELMESDTEKGGLFEGYMGHDSFNIIGNDLVREFPTYTKTDIASDPTGPRKKITYSLKEKKGYYSIDFVKEIVPKTASTSISTTTIMNR